MTQLQQYLQRHYLYLRNSLHPADIELTKEIVVALHQYEANAWITDKVDGRWLIKVATETGWMSFWIGEIND